MSLTGCTPWKQIVKTEYVRQEIPPLPAEPEYYPVVFTGAKGFYTLDGDNAKNLLKNRLLDKGYGEELRAILTNMKEPETAGKSDRRQATGKGAAAEGE